MTAPAPVSIAFGIDRNYLPAMAAVIASILQSNPGLAPIFHVMASDLLDADKKKLADFARQKNIILHLYQPDEAKLARLPDPRAYTRAIYHRFFLCDMLAGKTDRVLYLDADIICLGDISLCATLDMQGKIVTAVADVEQEKRKSIANTGAAQPYFNSGVMLIDVKKWNAENMTAKVLTAMEENRARYAMPDQDALNEVLAGQVLPLGRAWNSLFDHFPVTDETVFLHYAGGKPWQEWSANYRDPRFAKALAATPWADWRYLPVNRKQRNKLAQHLFARGNIVRALYWYLAFLLTGRKSGI